MIVLAFNFFIGIIVSEVLVKLTVCVVFVSCAKMTPVAAIDATTIATKILTNPAVTAITNFLMTNYTLTVYQFNIKVQTPHRNVYSF